MAKESTKKTCIDCGNWFTPRYDKIVRCGKCAWGLVMKKTKDEQEKKREQDSKPYEDNLM